MWNGKEEHGGRDSRATFPGSLTPSPRDGVLIISGMRRDDRVAS